jgi:mannose-6-phosphate isomerase-like protein (cupin superfamily)
MITMTSFVPKAEAEKIPSTPHCTVWEYRVPSQTSSFCTAKISGRYPETGEAANSGCEQLYYVISGSGTIHSERGDFPLEKGDLYHFQKGEWYWVEGKKLTVAVVNSPPWSQEQYIHRAGTK